MKDWTPEALTHLVFASAAALLLLAVGEYAHYRELVAWEQAGGGATASAAIAWLLWSKSLLPTLLLIPPLGLLLRSGYRGSAHLLATLSLGAGTALLVLDLWCQAQYGSHAASYLPFIWSAITAFGSVDHAQWVGDPGALAMALGLLLGATGLACVALWLGARAALRVATGGLAAATRQRLLLAGTLLYIAAVLGGVATAIEPPALRQRLLLSLPYTVDFGSESVASARPQQPRIVGVIPQPWESSARTAVLVHNPSGHPLSLSGWQIENLQGQRAELDGEIAAGEMLRVDFEREHFEISHAQDGLWLLTPTEEPVSRIDYQDENVKRGAVLWYPSGSLEEVLRSISVDAGRSYAELFDEIMRYRPAALSAQARQSSRQRPNVILLVLDSFHFQALGLGLMPRLSEWAEQGLRANRHYASTNSSHLGLFTLLHARLALSYDAVLDDGGRPQAIDLFGQLGYSTAFISSGDIEEWKRMDEFLNEANFDRFIVNAARIEPHWQQWTTSDAKSLADIRELLASPQPHFVLGFLMSTHFPYPYREGFQRYEPVSHEDESPGWVDIMQRSFDRKLLWNRYRNALLSIEAELMDFIESLDPARNLIVITGDHGESFGEDGTLVHGSRASDVQNRVPMLLVGPGVTPREIASPTTHMDLLPTLLHAATGVEQAARGLEGRDLLASPQLADQLLVSPYKLNQPHELLLIRGDQRLLLHARTDRPELSAFAFVDESGFPRLDLDLESIDSPHAWTAALRVELERLAGHEH